MENLCVTFLISRFLREKRMEERNDVRWFHSISESSSSYNGDENSSTLLNPNRKSRRKLKNSKRRRSSFDSFSSSDSEKSGSSSSKSSSKKEIPVEQPPVSNTKKEDPPSFDVENVDPTPLTQEETNKTTKKDAGVIFDPTELLVEHKTQSKQSFYIKDKKAPLIWTIGYFLIALITTLCSFFFSRFQFLSYSVNPFFGVDETSMISFGAKYGPFMYNGQWWRFFTANAIHAGLIHLVICGAVFFSTYIIERFKGFWTALLLFLLSGVYGYILSAMFIPDITACGSNGAIMGYLGWLLVEVLSSWRQSHRIPRLLITIFEIVIIVIMGLLPFNDNFCNVGGIVMGILGGLTMMPNTAVSKVESWIRLIIAFLAFPIMATVFCLCLVLFIRNVNTESLCSWCRSAACIDFSSIKWCPPSIGY